MHSTIFVETLTHHLYSFSHDKDDEDKDYPKDSYSQGKCEPVVRQSLLFESVCIYRWHDG